MFKKRNIRSNHIELKRNKNVKHKRAKIKFVQNPGFTGPNFSPWVDLGDVYLSTIRPNIGDQSAFFTVQPGKSATLSQRVTLEEPGDFGYRLIYSLLADRFNNKGVFQVSFLNTGIGRTFQLSDVGFRNYQTFQIDFTRAAINDRSFVDLEFRVNGAGSVPSLLLLDTVVIVPI